MPKIKINNERYAVTVNWSHDNTYIDICTGTLSVVRGCNDAILWWTIKFKCLDIANYTTI